MKVAMFKVNLKHGSIKCTQLDQHCGLLLWSLPFPFPCPRHFMHDRIQLWSCCEPNVVVDWLTLVIRTWEVRGPHLILQMGYRHWGLLWLFSVRPGVCRDSTSKQGHNHFFLNPFQFTFILRFKECHKIRSYEKTMRKSVKFYDENVPCWI
jgi:hypothetical protein